MLVSPPQFYNEDMTTRYLGMPSGISFTHQGLIPVEIFKKLIIIKDDLDICKSTANIATVNSPKNKNPSVQEIAEREARKQSLSSLKKRKPLKAPSRR